MALPKVKHPLFTLELISTGEKIKYRPFTVKEEKIILAAQMSKDVSHVVDAVKQVINNCVIQDKFDVEKLASFDIEYLFLNLRSKSVNNIVEIIVTDGEDKKDYKFEINLDDIKPKKNPDHKKKIELLENLGVVMRYPGFESIQKISNLASDTEGMDGLFEMIGGCIEQIYDGDKLYVVGEDFNQNEVMEFIYDLPVECNDKLRAFFDTFPTIEHTINYKNSLGNERSYTVKGIYNFFT